MQNQLVSILTPFKNTVQYLPECINSILNQTHTNWELLIVDDGSTDESYKVVKNYSDKDSRIKLLKNSGNGIIDALRLAFKYSKGEYITRMDSDDIMTPKKLEILATGLQTHGKQHLAIGLVKYFSSNGINDGYAKYEAWLNDLTKNGANFSEIYKECVIPSPCWMVHREDLIACGAFEPNNYPEDYDLTFRFFKHGFKCIPCNTVLHEWRDYSSRTSRTHEHYAENHFIDLKLRYFLELHYDNTRPLAVWGAGNKGKYIAKLLVEKNIPFEWICDNPKKIGKHIYDQEMKNFNYLEVLKQPQSIISVANLQAQEEIKHYFKTQNMNSMADYFFFC